MLTSNYEVLGTKKNLNRMLSGSLDDWPSFFAVNMARGTVTVSVERDYVTLADMISAVYQLHPGSKHATTTEAQRKC